MPSRNQMGPEVMILRPEKSGNRSHGNLSLLQYTFLVAQGLRMNVPPSPEVTGLVREQPRDDTWEEGGNGTAHQEPSGCWENSHAGGNNF